MRNTILILLAVAFLPLVATAQFFTITKEKEVKPPPVVNRAVNADNKADIKEYDIKTARKDTIDFSRISLNGKAQNDRKGDKRVSLNGIEESVKEKWLEKPDAGLPELTIHNLYKEIIRNGIRHPKIVLAQAILETGWFRSKACRHRNNLFGLTNPRTGRYYKFGHWTESVRAYYTKVQYRYSDGNYLLWLRDIGYAEDPNYIRSVIGVLRMLYVTAEKGH